MVAELCADERTLAGATAGEVGVPGPKTGSATSLPPLQQQGPALVTDWRGFHIALRRAALAATQSGAALSLLMLELAGPEASEHGDESQRIDTLAGVVASELCEASALARYAQHRLAVIMMETDLSAAIGRAEQIARSLPSGGNGDRASASAIGVAQFRDDESLGHLIERAEEALGRAKTDGGSIAVARHRVQRRPRALPGSCEHCPYGLCVHACLCGSA